MKKPLLFISLILASQILFSQNSKGTFELGSTLFTSNGFNENSDDFYTPDRPLLEYANGIFFRYNLDRFSFRSHASYTNNLKPYLRSNDFRIGIGGQYSFLKKQKWLYSFLDLSYRNVYERDELKFSGSWDNTEKISNSHGLDAVAGLGAKIKIYRGISLSPELGYSCSAKFSKANYFSTINTYSWETHETSANLNPVAKVHLTYSF
jgi:hypothetical protein